jgi:Spy/CpxP family protein refolding chaperone
MKKLIAAALTLSTLAFAAPPAQGAAPAAQRPGAAAGELGGWGDREERREDMEKRMRMMLVVGIAEALNLNETDAIRLADKIKVFDDKRKPLREQMHDSMKVLKAAADGDQAALGKVDQATTTLLDLRQQMAAVDKEMFIGVSKDLTPQKRAQLALFLAKFMHERKGAGMGFGGGGPRGGRHAPQSF